MILQQNLEKRIQKAGQICPFFGGEIQGEKYANSSVKPP